MSTPPDDTTSTELVAKESIQAVQIRHVEKRVSGDQGAIFLAMPGAAVPTRGRIVMNVVYAAPGLTFLAARLATIGSPFTPGWKVLAGASIVAEIGLLAFRPPLARVIERATVRWTEPSASGDRPDPRSPPLKSAIVGSERSPLVIRFASPPTVGRPGRLLPEAMRIDGRRQ